MGVRGRHRPSFTFVEKSVPDPRRVENGLRILGRLVAEAYARERALVQGNGHADPAWTFAEEESNDASED